VSSIIFNLLSKVKTLRQKKHNRCLKYAVFSELAFNHLWVITRK